MTVSQYPQKRPVGNRFQPVGCCIYCMATRYSSQKKMLGKEHIVPFGIGGYLVLPEASCQKCERIICRAETLVLLHNLSGIRHILGVKSRKKKKKHLRLYDNSSDPPRTVMIDPADYPVFAGWHFFEDARILTGLPLSEMASMMEYHLYQIDEQKLIRKYGLSSLGFPEIHTRPMQTMLAKIAHASAIAVLGLGQFTPMLTDVILNESVDATMFVGGIPFAVPPSEGGSEVRLEHIEARNTTYLIAQIRFLGFLGTPVYRVVVGTLSPEQTLLVPKSQLGVQLHDRTIPAPKWEDYPTLPPPARGRGIQVSKIVPALTDRLPLTLSLGWDNPNQSRNSP